MPRSLKVFARLSLVPLVALVLTSCSDDDNKETSDNGTTTQTEAAPNGDTVTIEDFKFTPASLEVKAGTKVTVKNDGGTTHTFTSDDGHFDTGEISAGDTATVDAGEAGEEHTYHCEIHSSMKGTFKTT